MIEVSHLSKHYGNVQALHDFTSTFEPGIIYGVVGANGAGKTTLFKCIAGMIAYQGTVKFTATPRGIGYLPTHPDIISHLTGMEYLRLMCQARNVDYVRLGKPNPFELPLKQYARSYSTGMLKKLALTAIALQGNDIFLLDEPFSGVDLQSNLVIEKYIGILKAENRIVLLSSHILPTLENLCDRILVIDSGKLIDNVARNGFTGIKNHLESGDIEQRLKGLFPGGH